MDKQVYKPKIKKFLGKDVRVIEVGIKTYIVLKDMFNVLGRLRPKDGQIHGDDRNKLKEFLIDLDIECAVRSFTITSKTIKSKSRETQYVDCLDIESAPIVITQFRPTAKKGAEALKEWCEFMKWVNKLLMEAKAHEIILRDKEEQKRISQIIKEETNTDMVIVNNQICIMMAKLIGVYPHIKKLKKDELKIYQPHTTIDLIEVRQEALQIYQQNLVIFEHNDLAFNATLKYLQKRYKKQIEMPHSDDLVLQNNDNI